MRVCRTRILSMALAILLCCSPELLFAISGQNAVTQNGQSSPTQSVATPENATAPTSGVPDAPQAQPNSTSTSNSTGQNGARTQQEPEGTAAARAARTIGGPASKPAGSAIAPAKQRQVRSLFIKIGAIAAAGAAVGTVYALTRGTPSKPPGAH